MSNIEQRPFGYKVIFPNGDFRFVDSKDSALRLADRYNAEVHEFDEKKKTYSLYGQKKTSTKASASRTSNQLTVENDNNSEEDKENPV